MPLPSPLPAPVAQALKLVSAALDDIAAAHRQLQQREARVQALLTEVVNMLPAATRTTPQMMQVQMAMQRENMVFTSVSNVLKLRHDSAKNAISN